MLAGRCRAMDVEDDGLALILNWQDLLVIISEIRDYGLPFEKTIKECNKKALVLILSEQPFESYVSQRIDESPASGCMCHISHKSCCC